MTAWAACIPSADCEALAPLRLFPGVECTETDGMVWLRGKTSNEELGRALTKVPGLERFELLVSDRLKSPHSRIPSGTLPATGWRPLKEALVPMLPSAALAGESRQKLAVTLVRSQSEQAAGALLTNLEDWSVFAGCAPAVRLEPLAFAVAEDQNVLVLGQPLPALRGFRYVNQAGILTPCGYAWSPAVEPSVLRDLFALMPGDVAVLAIDGTHQIIRTEQFVRATRSAVRLTAAGFQP